MLLNIILGVYIFSVPVEQQVIQVNDWPILVVGFNIATHIIIFFIPWSFLSSVNIWPENTFLLWSSLNKNSYKLYLHSTIQQKLQYSKACLRCQNIQGRKKLNKTIKKGKN